MKIRTVFCVLLLLSLTLSVSARRAHIKLNYFHRMEKSTPPRPTCEAYVNTNELTITFFQTLGNVQVIITDEKGMVVCSRSINAVENETFNFTPLGTFEDDQEYYLNISNGKQYLLAEFPLD